jgi:tetratricopeptide (TPR) repeat protein
MQPDIDTLIRASTDTDMTPTKTLEALGELVDASGDAGRRDGVEAALRWGERILGADPSDRERALTHYFIANAHATRRRLSSSAKSANDWDDPDLADQIRHLRLGLQSPGFGELPHYQKCQIHTNLANAFSCCGRLVEAMEWYDNVLSLDPSFGMAAANRALGLVDYANGVHEPARRNVIVRAARAELRRSLERPLEPGAEEVVHDRLARLEARAPTGFAWGQQVEPGTIEVFPPADRAYRRWGLEHRLFLDELCDLGWVIGARDTLTLPGHVVPLGEGPGFIGLFNQMKQEYVAARWLVFEGLMGDPHSADADVVLTDTMDYPALSFRTEQLRLAFRSAYSLFDRIAFFLNHYLSLDIPDEKVAFRTMWFSSVKPQKRLRPDLAGTLTEPLRALVWIGQDLFEPDSDYGAALLPDAQDLWELRRCLEHRYLKLHDEGWSEEWSRNSWRDGLRDDLARSLSRGEFADKALRLLKMVRAALMYLAWTMNTEESRRRAARDPEILMPPMVLRPLPKSTEPTKG